MLPNKPTMDLLKALRDTLGLKITDERLTEVLRALELNWELFQAIGNIPLDKEDDPAGLLRKSMSAG